MSPRGSELLVVDVENFIGAKAKPSTVTARMDALTQLTGPNVSIIAGCQGKQIPQEGVRILKGYGAKVMLVKKGKDAADHALIAEAHRATGCDRFVVASADAAFAQLADHGRLDVVIRNDQTVNKRFTNRATSVHRLPAPASSTMSLSGTDYLNALPDGGIHVPQELGEALCLAPKRPNVTGELVEVIVFGADHEADALTEATAWYDQHRQELILRALWIEHNHDPLPAPPGHPPDFRYEVCLAVTGCSLTNPPPPALRSV